MNQDIYGKTAFLPTRPLTADSVVLIWKPNRLSPIYITGATNFSLSYTTAPSIFRTIGIPRAAIFTGWPSGNFVANLVLLEEDQQLQGHSFLDFLASLQTQQCEIGSLEVRLGEHPTCSQFKLTYILEGVKIVRHDVNIDINSMIISVPISGVFLNLKVIGLK